MPATPRPTGGGDIQVGSGPFDLADGRVGLSGLSSYVQTLDLTFDGTKDGQAHRWSKLYRLLATEAPRARVLTISHSGDLDPADPSELADASGASYESFRDGRCTGVPFVPGQSRVEQLEPANLLGGLLGAEEAGTDPMGGVNANHYTFDERARVEMGLAETDGELWIAADGGYLLKYVRATTATATYFGEGLEGSMRWEYTLENVNQPVDAVPPAGCQIDAPPMADAANLLILPRSLGFDTPSRAADVTAFYQAQLPDRGWVPDGDPVIDENTQVSAYAKGTERLTVIVTTPETGTRVDILLTASGS